MSFLEMSVSGAVLIAAIIGLRALTMGKIPKKFYGLLWVLTLIRLLVPFKLPSALSVYNLFAPSSQSANASVIIPKYAKVALDTNVAAQNVEPTVSFDWTLIIWAVVAVALLVYFITTYVKCLSRFRTATPTDIKYAENYVKKSGFRRNVQVRESGAVSSPLTYGIIRPIIILPKNMDYSDTRRVDCILEHELAHIRNFDPLIKLLLTAALCLHWFNPLVWIMYALFNRDMELICDERAINGLGEEFKKEYAFTLITMEEQRSKMTSAVSCFANNTTKERIIAIMNFKKITISAIAAGLVLTLGVGAAFATSQATPATSNPAAAATQTETAPAPATSSPTETTTQTDASAPKTDTTPATDVAAKDDASSKNAEINAAPEDIEWWTYDDFKAKVDKEKAELAQMEGQTVKINGVQKTWTKADSDQTIAAYEKLLQDIKNGVMVSKRVKGSDDDILIMQNPDGTQTTLSQGDMEGDVEFEYEGADDENKSAEENAEIESQDEIVEAAAKAQANING